MRFEVLGPLRVHTAGAEITIRSARERTLLAMLLLHANRTVAYDQLVEAIWADQPPPGARNQLQGCVSRLRKRLTTTGLEILTEPGGYRATIAPDDLDLLDFRRLVAQARTAAAAGEPTEAVTAYRAALALWRGPALGGTDTGRTHAAAALDEEHIQIREECIEAELATGAAGRLVPELTELVGQHPHRERLHASLMHALYRADRQADALAAYRHARTTLHDELGIEPGAELQRLHQAILNRDPDLTPPATPPASASDRPTPRELPADVTGFTGRTEAIKSLNELLTDNPHEAPAPVVISAIAGTAGVGKTALAVHWAHRVADRFPDGQLYLNLRGYAATTPVRPIEALSALLRSLGTPPEQIPTDEAQAAALYRTQLAGRRALIVLDNARSVDQIRPLLPGSPGCLVLITSRDRLTGLVARDGATRLTLDTLTFHEAHTLLTTLLGPERAVAEPAAVADLARKCAYLPLALRIAAAHLLEQPGQPISTYLAELTSGDLLAGLDADGDAETAVRTTLEASYRVLPEKVQRIFRLLGLVPGPDFTAPAVAALANTSESDALSCLQKLAAGNLVSEHAPGRYSYHDLLGRYTRYLAEGADSAADRARGLERLHVYYVLSARSAAEILYPEMLQLPLPPLDEGVSGKDLTEHTAALAWLADERGNLVAAVKHSARYGPKQYAWLLAGYLRGHFLQWRNLVDLLSVATAALSAAEEEADPKAQAAAHLSLAGVHFATRNHPEAIASYSEAADLAERASWIEGQASALSNLGLLHSASGDLHGAARYEALSLALNQRSGRLGGQAMNHGNLGTTYAELGQLERAAENLSVAVTLFRRMDARRGEARSLQDLGGVYHLQGRMDEALALVTDALSHFREIGYQDGELDSLAMTADVLVDLGRVDDALVEAQACYALAVELDDPISQAIALRTLGNVLLHRGSVQDAEDHFQRSVGLARDNDHRISEVVALLGVAETRCRLGDFRAAYESAEQSRMISHQAGYRVPEGRALTLLAETCLGRGCLTPARNFAYDAIGNHRETGYRLGEARTLLVLESITSFAGEMAAAKRYRTRALALYTEIGAQVPENPSGATDGVYSATAPEV